MMSYSEIIRASLRRQGVLDTSVMVDDMVSARSPARGCRESRKLARGDGGARPRVEVAGHQPVASGRHGMVYRAAPGRLARRTH